MTTLTIDDTIPVYVTTGETFNGTILSKKDDEILVLIQKDNIESFKITMRYNYANSRYEADIKGNTINDIKLELLYLYD